MSRTYRGTVRRMEETVEAAFGRRVREARTERGWNQGRLAEVLDLDPSNISRLESGRSRLSLGQAVQVASALGVSLDSLLMATTPEAALNAALADLDAAVVVAREAMAAALQKAIRVADTAGQVSPKELRAAVGTKNTDDVLQALTARVSKVAAGTGATVRCDEDAAIDLMPLIYAIGERIT